MADESDGIAITELRVNVIREDALAAVIDDCAARRKQDVEQLRRLGSLPNIDRSRGAGRAVAGIPHVRGDRDLLHLIADAGGRERDGRGIERRSRSGPGDSAFGYGPCRGEGSAALARYNGGDRDSTPGIDLSCTSRNADSR